MKDVKDLKFMSLGGNCADIGYLGSQRVHGPVDNMFANKGLSSVKQLLENELFNDFNTNEGIKNSKTGWVDFQNYSLVHNERNEKFLKELKSRTDTFNNFLRDIHNDNNYFVYTLNRQDVKDGQLTKEFLDGFNWLSKQDFFDKIIFVTTPITKDFSSCFRYSYDFSEFNNLKVVQIWNMAANIEDDKRCYKDFISKVDTLLYKKVSKKQVIDKIENLKFMSIGGNCENIAFLGDQRVHGPIDNMRAVLGPKSGVDTLVHPDEIFNEITGKDFTIRQSGTGPRKCFKHFEVPHNDPSTEKYAKEFRRRLDIMQDFYKHIQDDDKFFVYSLNPYDVKRSDDGTHLVLTDLCRDGIEEIRKLGILDKVIFVGSVVEPFVKEKYFSFNSDEMYDIPGVTYIELKSVGTTCKEQSVYAHKQFLRKLRDL